MLEPCWSPCLQRCRPWVLLRGQTHWWGNHPKPSRDAKFWTEFKTSRLIMAGWRVRTPLVGDVFDVFVTHAILPNHQPTNRANPLYDLELLTKSMQGLIWMNICTSSIWSANYLGMVCLVCEKHKRISKDSCCFCRKPRGIRIADCFVGAYMRSATVTHWLSDASRRSTESGSSIVKL